jgi:hypothetical protein
MRDPKRACVPTQQSQASYHLDIGAAREEDGEQRIFPRPRVIDLIDDTPGNHL